MLQEFIKRATPASLYAPTATLGALKERNANPAFAAASKKEYSLDYYLRGALSGGICCGFTHGAVTPVDVVKVRSEARARTAMDESTSERALDGASTTTDARATSRAVRISTDERDLILYRYRRACNWIRPSTAVWCLASPR